MLTSAFFSSQVLLPEEEEQLMENLIEMGKDGPIIYDRHFFILAKNHL